MAQGRAVEFADFVALVASFRIHHGVSLWVLLKQEAVFERIARVMMADGPVSMKLKAFGLTEDLKAWLVQKQLDRMRRDPRWQERSRLEYWTAPGEVNSLPYPS